MSNSNAATTVAKIICGLAALTVLGLPAGMPLADSGGGTAPVVTTAPSVSPDGHGWID
jgi:hypothetical protein